MSLANKKYGKSLCLYIYTLSHAGSETPREEREGKKNVILYTLE
jgi:hypothetical protein